MRLFITLILGAFLVVVGWQSDFLNSQTVSQPTDDYTEYMWSVHHDERPFPTDILAQVPAEDDAVSARMVTYGTLEGKEG